MSERENKSSEWDFLVWLVIVAVIGLLAWMSIPNFSGERVSFPANKCINELRQIDAAAQQFALEKGKTNGEAINFPADLTPYIKLDKNGKIFPCPQGGVYSLKKVGDKPTCSLGTNVNPPHVMP